jgi:hypothetical protein
MVGPKVIEEMPLKGIGETYLFLTHDVCGLAPPSSAIMFYLITSKATGLIDHGLELPKL